MLPLGVLTGGAFLSAWTLKLGPFSASLHVLTLFALAGGIIIVSSFILTRLFRVFVVRE